MFPGGCFDKAVIQPFPDVCSQLIRLVSFPFSVAALAAHAGESRLVTNTRGLGRDRAQGAHAVCLNG